MPTRLIGATVHIVVDHGALLVVEAATGVIVAEHELVAPGAASILDAHYDGPRPAPSRGPRPKTSVEQQFCALGADAEAFLVGAAAIGNTRLGSELEILLGLGAAHGEHVLVAALRRAVAFGRFRAADVRSILAAGADADVIEIALNSNTVLVARVEVERLADRYRQAGFRPPTTAERRGLRITHPMPLVFMPGEHTIELPRPLRVLTDPAADPARTVDVPVEPDAAQYIRHGYDPAVSTITVDLRYFGADDRALIADYYRTATSRYANLVTVPAATTPVLLAALRNERREREERHREDEQGRTELVAEARPMVTERRTCTRTQTVRLGDNETVHYE